MKKLLLLLLFPLTAFAGEAVVNWGAPTTYVDGTPVLAGDIKTITVEWGPCLAGAMLSVQGTWIDPTGQATSTTIRDLPKGTYCFHVFATTNGHDRNGMSPDASLALPLTTSSTVAYTIGKDGAIYRMLPVGTVPLNVPCREAVKIAGLYQIPNNQVTTKSLSTWFFGVCR